LLLGIINKDRSTQMKARPEGPCGFRLGSLMTGGWEVRHNCLGRHLADLAVPAVLVTFRESRPQYHKRNWGPF